MIGGVSPEKLLDAARKIAREIDDGEVGRRAELLLKDGGEGVWSVVVGGVLFGLGTNVVASCLIEGTNLFFFLGGVVLCVCAGFYIRFATARDRARLVFMERTRGPCSEEEVVEQFLRICGCQMHEGEIRVNLLDGLSGDYKWYRILLWLSVGLVVGATGSRIVQTDEWGMAGQAWGFFETEIGGEEVDGERLSREKNREEEGESGRGFFELDSDCDTPCEGDSFE